MKKLLASIILEEGKPIKLLERMQDSLNQKKVNTLPKPNYLLSTEPERY